MTENKGSEASGDDGAPEQNKTEQKRIAVTIGIGFLFAPISVATTATLSKQPNNAAASLFVMARNIGGSVGMSVVTSLVTSRSQVHMAYLSTHLTALDPGFGFSLAADGRARRPRGARSGHATVPGRPRSLHRRAGRGPYCKHHRRPDSAGAAGANDGAGCGPQGFGRWLAGVPLSG